MGGKKIYANAHERRRAADRRRREREGWAGKPKPAQPRPPMPTSEAVALYRSEKAAWLERTKDQRAEIAAAVKRAIARADGEPIARRGGRKGKPDRGLDVRSTRGNELVNALRSSQVAQ